jgi:hypothetical protein
MIESDRPAAQAEDLTRGGDRLAPAWREFIRFCRDLRHGEIERLSIQDGIPVLAEVTKRKIKFDGRT